MSTWKPASPPFHEFKKEVFTKAASVTDLIYQIGEYEQLRKPSQDIPQQLITSTAVQDKISYIKDCLIEYRRRTGYGRGISGVQIGIPERFAVIYMPDAFVVIINPHIIKHSDKQLKYPEMCMSASPVIAPVIRPAWIEFEYFDEHNEKQYWNTKDDTVSGKLLNRVFQHEIDHMDGIINIDRVRLPKELILESDPSFYEQAAFEEV